MSENTENSNIKQIPKETISFLQTIKESMGSMSIFFSLGYTILIIISISYNLGYFKYINPQFIELMSIGDYINDTLDNLWFFLIFICLFFASSLGAAKKHTDSEFPNLILYAALILCITVYSMFKGGMDNKFWYSIKIMAPSAAIFNMIIFTVVLIIIAFGIASYRFSLKYTRNDLPKYTPALVSILLFVIVVLCPYLLGNLKGNFEQELITRGDYNIHEVNIYTSTDNQILKDVYILKELEKGVVIRQFIAGNDSPESNFIFIHWNDVKRIKYKDTKKLFKNIRALH